MTTTLREYRRIHRRQRAKVMAMLGGRFPALIDWYDGFAAEIDAALQQPNADVTNLILKFVNATRELKRLAQ